MLTLCVLACAKTPLGNAAQAAAAAAAPPLSTVRRLSAMKPSLFILRPPYGDGALSERTDFRARCCYFGSTNMHAAVLRYLDEVARQGSIRKAADALHIASSAVNRQILPLVGELGTSLF